MTIQEYHQITGIINVNAYERMIYLEIERYVKEKGKEIWFLTYDEYMGMRNRLDAMNRTPYVERVRDVGDTMENDGLYMPSISHNKKGKSKNRLTKEEKRYIRRKIGNAAALAMVGILFYHTGSWVLASLCVPVCVGSFIYLLYGFLDYIPLPKNYDCDAVDRYFKAQEDARLNTRAYLNQTWLHREEIAMLHRMIEK